jgi:transcriptional regulator with XRE-family HTH domain
MQEDTSMATMLVSVERLNEVFDSDPRTDSMIAESFHVSKQTISAWRTGSRSPRKSKLQEIADFYHKDIIWFFGYEGTAEEKPVPTEEDEQVKEIISLLKGMSDQKKAEAIRYLRYLSASEEGE